VRVLGSAPDAEDAVQETLRALARHAADFRGESQLSTWLYRVARNVCTDRIRHEARRPSTPVDDLTQVGDEPVTEDLVVRTTPPPRSPGRWRSSTSGPARCCCWSGSTA
jgi:RNA polymerase sigma factor (sigma-70 family)